MYFRDIPGHDKIKERLIRTVNTGRISHAQMFAGPEGCGKLALAIAYARYISCTNRGEKDACGECPSCIKYNKLAHPDLHFAYPASKALFKDKSEDLLLNFRDAVLEDPFLNAHSFYQRIGMENKQGLIIVEESRKILNKLSLKSYESEYKVLIMWLPERMNDAAANTLLKMIEEPPAGTVFLLVSETPEYILQTIQSRTQMIKIPKIQDEDIRFALNRDFELSAEKLEDAVKLANGNYFKAKAAVSEDEQNRFNFDKFVLLMRLAYAKDVTGLQKLVDEFSSIGREKQKLFLDYAIRLIRENFLVNTSNSSMTHMAGYEDDFSTKFSRFIHHRNVESLYEEFNLAFHHISANAYGKLVFLDLSLKIIKLLHI